MGIFVNPLSKVFQNIFFLNKGILKLMHMSLMYVKTVKTYVVTYYDLQIVVAHSSYT